MPTPCHRAFHAAIVEGEAAVTAPRLYTPCAQPGYRKACGARKRAGKRDSVAVSSRHCQPRAHVMSAAAMMLGRMAIAEESRCCEMPARRRQRLRATRCHHAAVRRHASSGSADYAAADHAAAMPPDAVLMRRNAAAFRAAAMRRYAEHAEPRRLSRELPRAFASWRCCRRLRRR